MEYNITNAEIQSIFRNKTKKDGTPYVTKEKKTPFTLVKLKFNNDIIDNFEFMGDATYIDFDDKSTSWQKGTQLTGTLKQNGQYWNFELPKSESRYGGNNSQEIDQIKSEIENIKRRLDAIEGGSTPVQVEDDPLKDLPF